MKYLFQFARILLFCIAGEALHYLLPLPVPSGIYGLVLLFAALVTGLVKLEQIKETAHFLTGIFLILFVPGTVGIIEHLETVKQIWPAVLIAVVLITAAVFGATGLVSQAVLKHKAGREQND